jgi:predicted GIY-YIG superfamily endonuclease
MSNIIKSIKCGYTSRANPRRGYHDSEDIVTFSGGTEEEQLVVMEQIRTQRAANNMWANAPKMLKENVWRINYGYDSGD